MSDSIDVRSSGLADSAPPAAGDVAPSWGAASARPRGGQIARFGLEAAGWVYLAMAALVCADVVGRRILGISTAATAEIGGYLLAVGIAWGLAGTLVERAHIRIDVFVQKAPLRIRAALHLFALAILAAAAGFALYAAAQVTFDSWQLGATDLTPLRTPLVVPQGLWTLGIAGFALAAVALFVKVLRATLAGNPAQADSICAPKTYVDEAAETLEALGQSRPAEWPTSSVRKGVAPATDASERRETEGGR